MENWLMREKIADVYNGRAWKDKVAKMEDDQVTAIYLSFLEKGVFDGRYPIKELKDTPQIVQQLSIDDFVEDVSYET
jgi:hypothetical protein